MQSSVALNNQYEAAFSYKLIYIIAVNDASHKGLLKIGDASLTTNASIDQLPPNCNSLNEAAKKRIASYTNTIGQSYELLHTELACRNVVNKDGSISIKMFRDYAVHEVLENSNIKKHKFPEAKGREWYEVDLDTAKKAIEAVKQNLTNVLGIKSKKEKTPVIFRPEQKEAIDKTLKYFKHGSQMLWNAKMRFGKTLTTLEVIKEGKFDKTLIITHRPVVLDSWKDDFYKIFSDEDGIRFGSKAEGIYENDLYKLGKKFVYFASIQDLRGSNYVGGKFEKNDAIYDVVWDLVVIDEAHEGTTTALGDEVVTQLIKRDTTKVIALSGTPFNIFDRYDEESSIYTWDYVMEQRNKAEWDKNHFGDSNPYEELPKLNIYTYNLGTLLTNDSYHELEDKSFNFTEFFKTRPVGAISEASIGKEDSEIEFCHKEDVNKFLDLISESDNESSYPYSSDEFRELFKHTLWMVPGVKEARALKALMQKHPIFGKSVFKIINVAGKGDEDNLDSEIESVKTAIKESSEQDYTITLSCGRLTTGVTVPEWTAVFMLAGSYSTSAANYLQTIFRVQSPCNINGKYKTNCYVFDFAPDRTLKMLASAVSAKQKAGKTTSEDRDRLGELLNFCPVISFSGTKMEEYSAEKLLQHIKKAYAEKAIRNGFDDTSLYNDELLKLDSVAVKEFNELRAIIGTSKSQKHTDELVVNNQGFTDEERERAEKAGRKPVKELTPEEKAAKEKLDELKKDRRKAISILRGISIRMPLMIYGADIPFERDFKIEDFLNDEIVDPSSWEEFMPKDVTKELFKKFIKYYDQDVFMAAGKQIRSIAKAADALPPIKRINKITELFSHFKNPDKETVLTPWRAVNMHISKTLGGYCFFDEDFSEQLESPRFVYKEGISDETFLKDDVSILEINSKSGLYPLYVAYSIYKTKCKKYDDESLTDDKQEKIWNSTVEDNIYVICKTPMAKSITKRTLVGYRDKEINAHYFEDLINTLKYKKNQFIDRVQKNSYWKKGNSGKMKFDAIVGNPPYQITMDKTSDVPVYNLFMDAAFDISPKVTFITPARFLFNAGKTPKEWNKKVLNDKHLKVVYYTPNSTDVFPNVDIKGGVAVTLRDLSWEGESIGKFTPFEELSRILQKVNTGDNSLASICYQCNKFNLKELYSRFPHYINLIGSNGRERRLTTKIFDLDIFSDHKILESQIPIIGLIKNNRVTRYVDASLLDIAENLNTYKVLVPKSNGTGALGECLSTPMIVHPMEGHTQSFISFGKFSNENEAICCLKYIKTKFVRCLLGTLKVTQDNPKDTWKNIPLQDFTDKSDIDWKKTIDEIDFSLYEKYKLSKEEIDFIEKNIQKMD